MKLLKLLKNNPLPTVAVLAAAVTVFFVPPDAEYASYFDVPTLACLFCTLAVIAALKNIAFFRAMSQKIVYAFHTVRKAVAALVAITYFGSMIIANDMALLTFLPLGYFVLERTDNRRYMAFTFILQTAAANLGGMLTPFGNPQNLYLYSHFNFTNAEFFSTMLPPFLLSAVLIAGCCLLFKNTPLRLADNENYSPQKSRVAVYLALFAVCIAAVFRLLPWYVGLAAVLLVLPFFDYKALLQVDYGLLLTFTAFFVFSGNLSRVEAIRGVMDSFAHSDTLLLSVLSCQLISNVPTAVLLSNFDVVPQQLLVGVNIGGVGTLISSLASLITFREYNKRDRKGIGRYLAMFFIVNFAFLLILTAFCELIMRG